MLFSAEHVPTWLRPRFAPGDWLDFELDWLLKLRLVVARHGEQDIARWWNSTGQLGARGASVLRRGFPRTHHFAQARSVFAAAEARCSDLFNLRDAHTLWRLADEVEEAFEQQWERWLDDAASWTSFFQGLAANTYPDVRTALLTDGLVAKKEVESVDRLPIDSSGQSIRIAEGAPDRKTIALLALGFSRGAPGKLVVPYVAMLQ